MNLTEQNLTEKGGVFPLYWPMPRKATGKPTGRPGYKPTEDDRKTVSLMCAVGIPHESIALCIGDSGIDDKTMRKYFAEELKTAKIKANAKIGGSIFNAAMSGNMTAATLWARTQMGWTDKQVIEHTGTIERIERVFIEGPAHDGPLKMIDGEFKPVDG